MEEPEGLCIHLTSDPHGQLRLELLKPEVGVRSWAGKRPSDE